MNGQLQNSGLDFDPFIPEFFPFAREGKNPRSGWQAQRNDRIAASKPPNYLAKSTETNKIC